MFVKTGSSKYDDGRKYECDHDWNRSEEGQGLYKNIKLKQNFIQTKSWV